MHTIKISSLRFFLFFFISYCSTVRGDTLFDVMARDNLRTIIHSSEEENLLNALIKRNKKFYQVLEATLTQQQNLSSEKKRRLAFALFSNYERENPSATEPSVLDTTSWQDLEMLSGPKSNLAHYIAAKIDRTATEIGRITLYKKLIQPSCDPEYLHTNQTIIKELTFNTDLLLDLNHYLERLKQTESIVLSLWEEDIFESILKQSSLTVPCAPAISEWADKSTILVELTNTGRLASLLGVNFLKALAAVALPAQGVAWLTKSSYYDSLNTFNNQWGLKAVSILSISGYLLSSCETKHPGNKKIETISNIISGPMGGVDVLYFEDQIRNEIVFKKSLQAKLIAIAQYIDTLKQLAIITQKNTVLVEKFPAITTIAQDLQKLTEKSSEIKQLLGLLETNTFKGNPRFISLYGRMYVAYKLLTKTRHELIPFMITIGKLDAYVSSANLVTEFKTKQVNYCFPEYVLNASQPFIEAERFWNPAIDFQKVVPSSISIGQGNRQNVIVTGPNAGGKSTVIKGLIVNIIMAQSLGIAAAKSLTFTPFHNIMTYLNITDDIAAGNSHFKAGVLRARQLIKTADTQIDHNFSFTAVDEVFNGTSHEEGQAAAYSLIEQLGNYKNNICITVTHFPKVTLLEERTNNFTNYKVTVEKDSSGKIIYPYKLEKGISNQIIALDILRQEGFGDTFLNKAQEILNES